jgi:putative membrane protein
VSNLIERWLGLGRVQIQTASGQSGAEMTIEGLPDFEFVRDELYQRMRGARRESKPALASGAPDDVVHALNAATAELRALREDLARRG